MSDINGHIPSEYLNLTFISLEIIPIMHSLVFARSIHKSARVSHLTSLQNMFLTPHARADFTLTIKKAREFRI